METRPRGRATVPAVLLFIVVSQLALATVFKPVNSDTFVYERYAASLERGSAEGRSFSVAHDEILREVSLRDGQAEPTGDALLVEYPPLSIMWMVAAGSGQVLGVAPGAATDPFEASYRSAMFIVGLLVILVVVRWAAPALLRSPARAPSMPWRLGVYGLGALILANLVFARLDLVLGALLLVSVVLLVRGSWVASFLVLAIAINFKASPIALAPLWVLASLRPVHVARMRDSAGAAAAAALGRTVVLAAMAIVVFLPFVVREGARSLDFVRFRALQGIHIESVPGSMLLVLHEVGLPLDVSYTFGTYELRTPISGALSAASPVLLLIGSVAILGLYVRSMSIRVARVGPTDPRSLARIDPPTFLTATVATLLLTLVASKLLSPQYLLWVLPLIPLLDLGATRTRRFHVWFLATCLVSTAIFPYLLGRTLARADPAGHGYLDPTVLGVALVVVRNTLLIWVTWLAVRALLRSRSDPLHSSMAGTATE